MVVFVAVCFPWWGTELRERGFPGDYCLPCFRHNRTRRDFATLVTGSGMWRGYRWGLRSRGRVAVSHVENMALGLTDESVAQRME